jgi:hypothetical protein
VSCRLEESLKNRKKAPRITPVIPFPRQDCIGLCLEKEQ